MFRQPTDVAWDSQGNIYITDGYVNSRVAKYDKNGDWVKSWGTKGTGPGQFRTPHAIAIDKNDNVYVGDRANQRIQVFDTDGKFLRMFSIDVPPEPGTPCDLRQHADRRAPRPGDRRAELAVHHAGAQPGDVRRRDRRSPDASSRSSLDGKVLGVIGKSGRNLKQFSGAHGLACPSENEIYVAETSNWRVQKLRLHPE